MHNKPTTGQERTQENCALFCVYTAREKEDTKTKQQKRTRRGQQRQSPEDMQRDKTRAKRIKTRAKRQKARQTRNNPLIRLTTHAHKSPTSHAKHQNNTNPHETPKPPKNALKTRNKGIFKHNAPKTKRESGQKAERSARSCPILLTSAK